MSTRSHIAFYGDEKKKLKDFDVLIYRHSDGYPEGEHGVINTIMPVLKDFRENRGTLDGNGLRDTCYASAWLIAKLKTDFYNYGITQHLYVDIEYFYAVYPDRLEVYDTPLNFEVKWPNNAECLKKYKKIDTLSWDKPIPKKYLANK